MKLNVVNLENKKTGDVEVNDAVFGGRVKTDLIWASVVRQNAGERAGTHKAKSRGQVSGSGKKPYAQKGTGRPQVGSSRTPLWRLLRCCTTTQVLRYRFMEFRFPSKYFGNIIAGKCCRSRGNRHR